MAAHHKLGLAYLDGAAADIEVGLLDGHHHLGDRDVVGHQLVGIDRHLVLFDETAEAGHLAHPFQRGQFIAQIPVLDGAQFLEIVAIALEGVFIDPADPGGIGTENRRHPLRQFARDVVEVLEDPGPGPVHVGAVLEDDIDEAAAEKGVAAHHLGAGDREHLGGQRIGDLVLDDLRGLAGVLGEDDDLDIGEVGDGIDRGIPQGIDPADDHEQGQQDDQEFVAESTS